MELVCDEGYFKDNCVVLNEGLDQLMERETSTRDGVLELKFQLSLPFQK